MNPNERGEGNFSTIIGLIIFAAVLYAGWNVVPVFIDNYAFKDKMNEIARLPRGQITDEKIMDRLMKDVRERRLTDYIKPSDCQISTIESNRRIACKYERTVEVLPGQKHTFKFNNEVEQPLIF